jgi:peptidoglycan hydrolase-like protein with peptidoglycan-binding domain
MGLGDAGTDVGMLQEAFGLPATGVYDKNTSRKIAQWQAANSLPRSGYFGAASREVFARSAQMQMRRVVVTSETYGAGGRTRVRWHPVEAWRRPRTSARRSA